MMDEWIDIYSDEPNEGELVLVAWIPVSGMPTKRYKHFYGLATYEEGEYHWYSEKDYKDVRVLAWMRLPEYFEEG